MRPGAPPQVGRLAWSPGLNKTVLGGFSGQAGAGQGPGVPPGAAGSYAGLDSLCGWAIARRMAAASGVVAALEAHGIDAPALQDDGHVTAALMNSSTPWPAALDRLVGVGDDAAMRLADELAVVLGVLVATLVVAPRDARVARPDWPESYWDLWRSVRMIALGGGLLAGPLGVRLVGGARSWLAAAGIEVTLVVPNPAHQLGLRGAASLLATSGVALDCGGTTIKRAAVSVGTGSERAERAIEVLPAAPAPGRVSAAEVVAVIANAAAPVVAHVARRPAVLGSERVEGVQMSISLATYVDDRGQPWQDQLGPYAPLGQIDFVGELATAVTQRTGLPVSLRVTHDGRAALLGARVTHPGVDAAIVLGTAIGNSLDPAHRTVERAEFGPTAPSKGQSSG